MSRPDVRGALYQAIERAGVTDPKEQARWAVARRVIGSMQRDYAVRGLTLSENDLAFLLERHGVPRACLDLVVE